MLSRFAEDADFGLGCTGGGVCFSVADLAGFSLLVLFRCSEANSTADAIAGGKMETAPGGSLTPLDVVPGTGEKSGTAPGGSLVSLGVVGGDFVLVVLVGTGDGKSCTAPGGSLTPLGVVTGAGEESGTAPGRSLVSLGVVGDVVTGDFVICTPVATGDGMSCTAPGGTLVPLGVVVGAT